MCNMDIEVKMYIRTQLTHFYKIFCEFNLNTCHFLLNSTDLHDACTDGLHQDIENASLKQQLHSFYLY